MDMQIGRALIAILGGELTSTGFALDISAIIQIHSHYPEWLTSRKLGGGGLTLSRTTISDICLVAIVGPSCRHHSAGQLDWGSLGKVWASISIFFFLFITLLFAGGFFSSILRSIFCSIYPTSLSLLTTRDEGDFL